VITGFFLRVVRTPLLMALIAVLFLGFGSAGSAQAGMCVTGSGSFSSGPCTGGVSICGNGVMSNSGCLGSGGCPGGVLGTSCSSGNGMCPGGLCGTTNPGSTAVCPGGGGVGLGGVCGSTQRSCGSQSCINITCPGGHLVPANVGCPPPVANQLCPDSSMIPVGQTCPSASPAPAQPVAATPASPPGVSVSYPSGWSIVGGPAGTTLTGAAGPLYAFQPGDTTYEVVPSGSPLKAGFGYLAFFPASTTSSIPVVSPPAPTTIPLPAGQLVLVGNPGNTTATLSGADTILVMTSSGSYASASTLGPGQGAWVSSNSGGSLTITNAAS